MRKQSSGCLWVNPSQKLPLWWQCIRKSLLFNYTSRGTNSTWITAKELQKRVKRVKSVVQLVGEKKNYTHTFPPRPKEKLLCFRWVSASVSSRQASTPIVGKVYYKSPALLGKYPPQIRLGHWHCATGMKDFSTVLKMCRSAVAATETLLKSGCLCALPKKFFKKYLGWERQSYKHRIKNTAQKACMIWNHDFFHICEKIVHQISENS